MAASPPVENGSGDGVRETAAEEEESWEQKGGERDCLQEEGMEEDEEAPKPKVTPAQPNAPKKEHVNVVFIGHVGEWGHTVRGGRVGGGAIGYELVLEIESTPPDLSERRTRGTKESKRSR